MKKLLSVILIVGMIMSNLTLSVSRASAEEYSLYTKLDMTNYYNSIGYLSETTAGTYTEDTANAPDFFIGKQNDADATTPYALSKESVSQYTVDGILTFNGVPYNLQAPDNEKGVINCNKLSKVTVPTAYYSQIKVLTVTPPTTISANNTIYSGCAYSDGTEGNPGASSSATNSWKYVADIAWAKVTAEDVLPETNAKIIEYTFNIPNKAKELNKIWFYTNEPSPLRVLAITMVGLKGEEWNPVIAEKIAELPEVSEITQSDYAAIAEVGELIELAEKDGADITAIEGIDKYNKIKEYQKIMDELYTSVDVSGYYNAIGYLSETTAGTYTEETANTPDFFIAKKSEADESAPYALSKESVDSLTTDGIAKFGGVPYILTAPDNEKGVINCSTVGKITVPAGYYSKIKVLAVLAPTAYGNNTIYRDFYYTDSTKATSTSTSNSVGTIAWANVLTTDNVSENATITEYTYEITDKTKKLKELALYTLPEATTRVLAITTVGLKGDEWNPIIATKIAELPETAEITAADYAAAAEIGELIKKAQAGGADTSSIEGIDKYNSALVRFDEIFAAYKPLNISSRFNANSFLSVNEAGSVTEPESKSYFIGKAVTSDSAFALNRDSVSELCEDGVLKYNGIPYNMPLPTDGYDSINHEYISSGISFTTGYYEELKILAATADATDSESGKIYYAIHYNDGTNSGTKTIKTKNHKDSSTENLVVSAGTVNATAAGSSLDGGNIYEYTITVPDTTKAAWKLDLATSGGTGTRILAITAKTVVFDNDGTGVADCSAGYENDDITIDISFENVMEEADITKENIVLTSGREAIDYTLTAVKEDDTVTGAEITLKNKISTADNYQLNITIGDSISYEKTFKIEKPILANNYLLKNSAGEAVEKVSDITDGKLTVTADVKNNTYTSGKAVKIITAVYNGEKLYTAKVTDADVAYGGTYNLDVTIDIPTEGLTGEWTAVAYLWDEDMITPIAKKNTKTYGLDAINDTSKDITAAFIGGSITQGGNLTNPFVESWQEDRTGKINYINAGQGGTMSNYGTMRLYEEVLEHEPDIVFIDFAGNDVYLTEEAVKANAESMVKQMESLEHQPVVVIWYFPHRNEDNYQIPQAAWGEAADYYGVGVLNAHQLCKDEIEAGNATWDDYTLENNVHPTAEQGAKIAELMYKDFTENYDSYIKNITVMPKKYNSDDYTKPHSVSSADAVYDANWTDNKVDGVVTEGYNVPTTLPFESFMATSTAGAEMSFKFRGTKLIISSLMGSQGRSAIYTITNSDGIVEKSGAINNYMADQSWYENVILSVTGLEDGEHTLRITVTDGTGLFGLGDFWIDE